MNTHVRPDTSLSSHEAYAAHGLRQAMRTLANGVSVITTGLAPNRTGFTATSVASLSMDPPRAFVCVNKASSSYASIRDSGIFAINFLLPNQQAIADRFAGRGGIKGEDRFQDAEWDTLVTGASVLRGSLASIDCELEELIERHSHAIAIGKVVAARATDAQSALIYWRGKYEAIETFDSFVSA
jgi:flavin reductase (DIM6/NTAB) family NADH-FMN oxidoreductase RutF